MTSHNPDLETYNADAAHTLPAVIAEMLVGSRPGLIQLLPALPQEWTRGTVRGIGTRAHATVEELHWDLRRRSVRVVLSSMCEQEIIVASRADGERKVVQLVPGRPTSLELSL